MSNASKYQGTYHRLSEAIARNDVSEMSNFIDTETFLAMLPGIEEPLTFWQFIIELDRQRKMFSDFGRHVEIKDMIADDNRLGVSYVMTLLNDGPLTNRDGRTSLPATNKRVRVNSMDTLTFNAKDRIIHLVVVSDRMGTLDQLGE